MDVTALDFVKALVDIIEGSPEVLLAGLAENVRIVSVDEPEGTDARGTGYDSAEVRISFGAGDLFDLKIERV